MFQSLFGLLLDLVSPVLAMAKEVPIVLDCLSHVFPNSEDDPVEYLYTRNSSGRVVSVDTRFKVPRDQIVCVETRDAMSGEVLESIFRFKKDIAAYFTEVGKPHPPYPFSQPGVITKNTIITYSNI